MTVFFLFLLITDVTLLPVRQIDGSGSGIITEEEPESPRPAAAAAAPSSSLSTARPKHARPRSSTTGSDIISSILTATTSSVTENTTTTGNLSIAEQLVKLVESTTQMKKSIDFMLVQSSVYGFLGSSAATLILAILCNMKKSLKKVRSRLSGNRRRIDECKTLIEVANDFPHVMDDGGDNL
jgi:hypothetical protein